MLRTTALKDGYDLGRQESVLGQQSFKQGGRIGHSSWKDESNKRIMYWLGNREK